jgi:hypothetical protein
VQQLYRTVPTTSGSYYPIVATVLDLATSTEYYQYVMAVWPYTCTGTAVPGTAVPRYRGTGTAVQLYRSGTSTTVLDLASIGRLLLSMYYCYDSTGSVYTLLNI